MEKEVEKNEKLESQKLESYVFSWEVPIEVGNFPIHNKVITNFPTSARTFQLHSFQFHFELSKFSFFQQHLPPTKHLLHLNVNQPYPLKVSPARMSVQSFSVQT